MQSVNKISGGDILVSIVNWNNSAATYACLESIAKIPNQQQPDIYLIDNDSTLEPFELAPNITAKLRSIIFIKNKSNMGFAGAHNTAIQYAQEKKYSYICLLNNDTIIQTPTLFHTLALSIKENSLAVASAPTILYASKPHDIWFAGGTININAATTAHNHFGKTTSDLKNEQEIQEVSFLTGCCLMMSLERFKNIEKKLDESFFLYWEDADWCAAALKEGAKLLYVKNESILHATSTSLGLRSPSYAYYNIRNRLLFAKKWSKSRTIFLGCMWTGFKIIGLSFKRPSTTLKTIWYVKKALYDGLKGNTGALK